MTTGDCKSAVFALRFESVLCHKCEHRSASDIVCPGETSYMRPAKTDEEMIDAEHRCEGHRKIWPHKREET